MSERSRWTLNKEREDLLKNRSLELEVSESKTESARRDVYREGQQLSIVRAIVGEAIVHIGLAGKTIKDKESSMGIEDEDFKRIMDSLVGLGRELSIEGSKLQSYGIVSQARISALSDPTDLIVNAKISKVTGEVLPPINPGENPNPPLPEIQDRQKGRETRATGASTEEKVPMIRMSPTDVKIITELKKWIELRKKFSKDFHWQSPSVDVLLSDIISCLPKRNMYLASDHIKKMIEGYEGICGKNPLWNMKGLSEDSDEEAIMRALACPDKPDQRLSQGEGKS